jgi:hypothetical protein
MFVICSDRSRGESFPVRELGSIIPSLLWFSFILGLLLIPIWEEQKGASPVLAAPHASLHFWPRPA